VSLHPDQIVKGGTYRVVGRMLKYRLRKITAERFVCGIRMVRYEVVGGRCAGQLPEASFANMALERVS
jgi:hypothetical protein